MITIIFLWDIKQAYDSPDGKNQSFPIEESIPRNDGGALLSVYHGHNATSINFGLEGSRNMIAASTDVVVVGRYKTVVPRSDRDFAEHYLFHFESF